MEKLAQKFRTAQFYAHAAHNLAEGSHFFSFHKQLGEFYLQYEENYDHVIERILGHGKEVNPLSVTLAAAKEAAKMTVQKNISVFETILAFDEEISAEIHYLVSENPTEGTANFLQGLDDQIEQRRYQLLQLLK